MKSSRCGLVLRLAVLLALIAGSTSAQPLRHPPGPGMGPMRPHPEAPRPPAERASGVRDGDRLEVPTPDGYALTAVVARPRSAAGPAPVVVILHGAEGFRPHYVDLARVLADAGFVAMAAAWFQGGRTMPDAIPCPRCPMFAGVTPASVPYVGALLDAARRLPDARADRLALFGHSAGAGVALLAAVTSGAGVQAVVLSGAGYGGGPRGGRSLMGTAKDLAAPLLILHGTADDQVPVAAAREYERALRDLGKPVEAEYVPSGPHSMTFDAGTAPMLQRRAVAFLRVQLAARYPDTLNAFVAAPDDAHGPIFDEQAPGAIVAYYRSVLGQLPGPVIR